MIVVADASPLRYLVAIGAVDVLKTLYNRVLEPEAVALWVTIVISFLRGRGLLKSLSCLCYLAAKLSARCE